MKERAQRLLRDRRGMTLIEITVVLVIIALLVVAVLLTFSNVYRAQLDATSDTMASMMRYLYHRSIIDNRPYRLVIDLEAGQYWGEMLISDDPCAGYLTDENDRDAMKARRERQERRAKLTKGLGGAKRGEGEAEEDLAPKGFQTTGHGLLRKRDLPKRVRVTGVMTSTSKQPRTEGQARIHFFPGGYAERAYIWLGKRSEDPDEDGKAVLTLELTGLMGRVVQHNEVLDEGRFEQDQSL